MPQCAVCIHRGENELMEIILPADVHCLCLSMFSCHFFFKNDTLIFIERDTHIRRVIHTRALAPFQSRKKYEQCQNFYDVLSLSFALGNISMSFSCTNDNGTYNGMHTCEPTRGKNIHTRALTSWQSPLNLISLITNKRNAQSIHVSAFVHAMVLSIWTNIISIYNWKQKKTPEFPLFLPVHSFAFFWSVWIWMHKISLINYNYYYE